MSVGFEIADGHTVLSFDAYTSEALIIMSIEDGEDDPGFGGDFTGDQLRQLRRFLEYCYPASEDPPHDPDPWEARSGGVPGGEG